MVEGGGFEPPKLARQIYSLIPLATREPLQKEALDSAFAAKRSQTKFSVKKPAFTNNFVNSVYSCFLCSGAATKSRTRDLLITNQLLYQLSYSGMLYKAVIINLRSDKLMKTTRPKSGCGLYAKSPALSNIFMPFSMKNFIFSCICINFIGIKTRHLFLLNFRVLNSQALPDFLRQRQIILARIENPELPHYAGNFYHNGVISI